jgi:hypothetical protein
MKSNPLEETAWEYGPIAFGALSVDVAFTMRLPFRPGFHARFHDTHYYTCGQAGNQVESSQPWQACAALPCSLAAPVRPVPVYSALRPGGICSIQPFAPRNSGGKQAF